MNGFQDYNMMKKIFFARFFALSLTITCTAQQYSKAKIDSMLTTLVNMHDSIPGKVLMKGKTCYTYAEKIDYKEGMIKSALVIGESYLTMGQYDIALEFANKAEKNAVGIKNNELLSEAFRLKGQCYETLSFFDIAFEEFGKALKAAGKMEASNDRFRQEGYIFSDMADCLSQNKKNTDSVKAYYRRSAYAFSKMEDDRIKRRNLSLVNANIGACFIAGKQYDSAAIYIENAVRLAEITQCDKAQLLASFNMGNLELARDNMQEAIVQYNYALAIANKFQRNALMSTMHSNLSKIYDKLGDKEKADYHFQKLISENSIVKQSQKKGLEKPTKELVRNTTQKFQQYSQGALISTISFIVLAVLLLARVVRFYRRAEEEKQEINKQKDRLKSKEELLEKAKKMEPVCLENVIRLAQNNDDSFLFQFSVLHFDFYEKITASIPALNLEDQKVCAFLRLGFQIKEIALITNVTVRSVEARIYRIRKKINISFDEG